MNYRSIAALNRDVIAWSSRLPADLDLVVGVPRSGLLVANLLALHRNLPLTDVEGLCRSQPLTGGQRCPTQNKSDVWSGIKKVLVVDDSVLSGREMTNVKQRLLEANIRDNVHFGACYVTTKSKNKVDYFYEVVPVPRAFEWNIMHGAHLPGCCVDIDGVLCRDPTEQENDDGTRYREFIETVPALVRPTRKVGWLVTCRLDKYRQGTEAWLAKHHIEYGDLIMMDFPDKGSRVAANYYAAYKASVYEKSMAMLFIESSYRTASEIVRRSGKPVLWWETRELITPSSLEKNFHRGRRLAKRAAIRLGIARRENGFSHGISGKRV